MLGDACLLASDRFISELYARYLQDPSSLHSSWRGFFDGFAFSKQTAGQEGDLRVYLLVQAYICYGYRKISYNPLQPEGKHVQELALETWGLSEEDLSSQVPTFGFLQEERVPLQELIQVLEQRFCARVGLEMETLTKEQKTWICDVAVPQVPFLPLWDQLLRAELFEQFLQGRYPGQLRFSLEGAETLIPLLWTCIEEAAELGITEVVLGMSHRGRLNVIANIIETSCTSIFLEFENHAVYDRAYDVKYHKGAFAHVLTSSGHSIKVTLCPNPSHLESVGSVVEGQVRALQEEGKKSLAILVHGDAALAGQGVVYETLQLSKLEGYTTGGTVHIVLNNHIGYTTTPEEGRSTAHCTDIAKTFGSLVIHMQAEYPEDSFYVGKLAMRMRTAYAQDVFIDLGCYRKYGHNEGDEPLFTQPVSYQKIKQKTSIRKILEERIVAQGLMTRERVEEKERELLQGFQETLTRILQEEKLVVPSSHNKALDSLVPLLSYELLCKIASDLTTIPQKFILHPKIQKLLQERKDLEHISWAYAEQLAQASLLHEGMNIRMSGQDACRGTFSQRHAFFVDQQSEKKWFPLAQLTGASYSIYNSPLSEFAVLGFELGYSFTRQQSLVLWEAQFGDFANEAQVIIDQYLACSEQKWGARSSITLLLPHGYEGKGPEHSSARMERFLQLCAEDNLFVVNCTTPAQFYHLLRRQGHLEQRRPLIVFTPKSLLRHPSCTSSMEELSSGRFMECLPDVSSDLNARKILLCSGKVFYDLLEERGKRSSSRTAILRIEQLYPFPKEELDRLLTSYPEAKEIFWVQEEPKNMGAWHYLQGLWAEYYPQKPQLRYIGRKEGASPAVGSYARHKQEQENLLQRALQEE
ncbi:MAG: 2-oxoglutarate dehydrogenase E1 component [Chlamydiae bacterium]|nr:2-oxoglutarate dehydrogenase E1 component [Chlamydiota bacterium]